MYDYMAARIQQPDLKICGPQDSPRDCDRHLLHKICSQQPWISPTIRQSRCLHSASTMNTEGQAQDQIMQLPGRSIDEMGLTPTEGPSRFRARPGFRPFGCRRAAIYSLFLFSAPRCHHNHTAGHHNRTANTTMATRLVSAAVRHRMRSRSKILLTRRSQLVTVS
jgi:hypothetical protein